MDMHCVSHQHKPELYGTIVRDGKEDITWRIERLLRLMREAGPNLNRLITPNTQSAYADMASAYERDGLKGALVHAEWLIGALKKEQSPDVGEIQSAAESLAIGLGLTW